MGEQSKVTGPDLTVPFAIDTLGATPLVGHVGEDSVMVVRDGDAIFATSASCTHYGGPLAEGLVVNGTVRCPWHHACFDLKTGAANGPALAPITCFEVNRDGGGGEGDSMSPHGDLVHIGKRDAITKTAMILPPSVVIVGAGPAGAACAVTLRHEGYAGAITIVGKEQPADRPNLSKDFLAGNAPEEWVWLRTAEALKDQSIDFVNDEVTAIDAKAKTATLGSKKISWDALVLATGADPITLSIEGAERAHVLRSVADAKAIVSRPAKNAVVIGASFIGLEVAASLRARGMAVTVVGPEAIPLARILGDDVGTFVRGVHEKKGVIFKLGVTPKRITETHVELSDGSTLAADLVVSGIGVRPNTKLAEALGLVLDKGIVTDDRMRTSNADIFCAGDAARYPYDGSLVRIEHFAVAVRHGQRVAREIVGRKAAGPCVPFFWSQHHDVTLSYVGHAEGFDRPEVRGDLSAGDATVLYRVGGKVRAVLTIGRDAVSLRAERAMEIGDTATLEAL